VPGINAVPWRESRPGTLKGIKGRSHSEISCNDWVNLRQVTRYQEPVRVIFASHESAMARTVFRRFEQLNRDYATKSFGIMGRSSASAVAK
jgi:hypothetical protein